MRKLYERLARRTTARPALHRLVQAGGFMRLTTGLALVVTVVTGLLSSCATAPASREDKAALVTEAAARWQQMRTADPARGALVQRGHGYALFPDAGKAGLGLRGEHLGHFPQACTHRALIRTAYALNRCLSAAGHED